MARTFSGSNYLKLEASQSPGAVGSIAFRFKPNWNSGDSQSHMLWAYQSAAGPEFSLQKYSSNQIFAGFYTGPVAEVAYDPDEERRIIIYDAPSLTPGELAARLFRTGVESCWVLTWDATIAQTILYQNGVKVGGYGYDPNFKAPFTVPSFDSLTIGNILSGGKPGDGSGAEFARFDYVLTPEEIQDFQWAGVEYMGTPPVHYVKILGDTSPEPAEVGANLVLVGTPAQATHPTFSDPPALSHTKPTEGTPINLSHPLADGLIMAWAFNEGEDQPIELVGNDPPAITAGEGWTWEADGSYHQTNNVLQYPSAVFDGLSSFTVCALMRVDVGSWGGGNTPQGVPLFPFPNFLVAYFVKELENPYTGSAGHESAFFLGYHHADEVDGSSGGRDELWCIVGPLSNWYVFRVSGIPWGTRYQQVFLVYDKDAGPRNKWTCRINGISHSTCDVYYDTSAVVPTTASNVMVGAAKITPDEAHRGRLQHLYAWEGARPDLWEPLLAEPYAFFEPATSNKIISGVDFGSVKTINSLPIASRKTWGGLE